MPISITLTEGVLPRGSEQRAAALITEAFLRSHGLAGNKVMTPNVTNHIHTLPKNQTLSGGKPFAGVWVEAKIPSFALSSRDVQESFFKEATDIIEKLSEGRLPREHIFANAVHTVDGTWNLNGRAMTNEQLGDAISRG